MFQEQMIIITDVHGHFLANLLTIMYMVRQKHKMK